MKSCLNCFHRGRDEEDEQSMAPCYGVPPVLVPERIDSGFQGQVTNAMRWPARWPHTHRDKRCPNWTDVNPPLPPITGVRVTSVMIE